MQEGNYYYRIATPEKVLCDKLYSMPPVANAKEMRELLIEDLRIEEPELQKLDRSAIEEYCDSYSKAYDLNRIGG